MVTMNVYEAKSSFSRLLAKAERGETILIARNGTPVAQVGPIQSPQRPVVFGDMRGRIEISDDFDVLGAQEESDWYGE